MVTVNIRECLYFQFSAQYIILYVIYRFSEVYLYHLLYICHARLMYDYCSLHSKLVNISTIKMVHTSGYQKIGIAGNFFVGVPLNIRTAHAG